MSQTSKRSLVIYHDDYIGNLSMDITDDHECATEPSSLIDTSSLHEPLHNKPMKSLSMELFNMEHYIVIPLLFTLSFFVYYDRGGLASAQDQIQMQLWNDNALKSGIVASCYLFGFCFTSPIFAILGSRYPPLKMSAIGMLVWCFGAAATGMLSHFLTIALARLLTGVGEASFLAFAGTIIDIIAPNDKRAAWMGAFYMGIALGYALGFAIGGIITSSHIIHANGHNQSWRLIFISETVIVLPLCAVLYCIKSPKNMLQIKQNMSKSVMLVDALPMVKVKRLLRNPTFVLTTVGYALQTFVTGVFGVETITFIEKVYGWTAGKAGVYFGIVTFIAGMTGSFFGGWMLDKVKGNYNVNTPHKYVKSSLRLLSILSLLAFPCSLMVVAYKNTYVFFLGAAAVEIFIFASQGPVSNTILWCVLYEDRPLAVALNTLVMHALGDACAPMVIGWVVDARKSDGTEEAAAYQFAIGMSTFWLLFASVAFAFGLCTLDWLDRWMIANNNDIDTRNNLCINLVDDDDA